jgi:2-acylglycerol O-acyltransferase 2
MKSVFGAAATTFLTWLVTKKSAAPSAAFYDLLTKTWNARAYYSKAELRGHNLLKPGKNFFAVHPHGCLSAGFTFNLFWNSEFTEKVGPVCFLIDEVLRDKNPLFRFIMDFYVSAKRDCVKADKANIKKKMLAKESLVLITGGFEDATLMQFGKDRIAMKKRKGFIKYCLEQGYQLHPVYTFGESDTYWTFTPLLKFRLWLNTFGIPAVAFFGNPICPILPRTDACLMTFIGPPLALPTIASPTPEEIDTWHAKYIVALQDLFDKHKAEAGKPDATLEIW